MKYMSTFFPDNYVWSVNPKMLKPFANTILHAADIRKPYSSNHTKHVLEVQKFHIITGFR